MGECNCYSDVREYYLGSDAKLNVSICTDTLTMDDMDFTCEFYTNSQKKFVISKASMIRKDEKNYIVVFNTNEIGLGIIKCIIYVDIPDSDCDDSVFNDILVINTGIPVRKL